MAAHRARIIESWTTEASRLASARGLDRPELLNVIPHYVEALAQGDDPSKGGAAHRKALIERHSAARLRQGFDVAEVVEELTVLCRHISAFWEGKPLEEQPTPEATAALYAELQTGAVDVLELFRQTRLRDGQAETRVVRRLRQIARESMRGTGGSLEERLPEMVELVREAMDAQSAALLLYEPAADRLVTSATAGIAREPLMDFVSMHSPDAFASRIAASGEEPTSVMDAETTKLEVSDTLRHSGIHALLGVRLPPGQELIGVLYVGLSEMREFTPSERYRIELLGERLVLHLENSRLFAARAEQLEALQRERVLRERFVSVLAHDLRGPLSVAKLGVQLMMKSPASTTPRARGSLLRSLERMERMISDLLDANRLRAGKPLPIELGPVEFGSIARGVVDELTDVYGERFTLRAPARVLGFADTDILHRALWNLAVNAVKYGAPGGPIEISVEGDGSRVLMSVHNEGNPIPPEDQPTLFEPYRRSSNVEQSSQTGWGLGLSLVRGAAKAHGGDVTVTSGPAMGTTFSVEIPVDARSQVFTERQLPEGLQSATT